MLNKPFRNPKLALAGSLAVAVALLVLPALAMTGPAAASGNAVAPALGQPDHIGYVVADLAATQRQVTAATGARFQVSKTSVTAWIAGHGVERATLRRGISSSGGSGPVLELVQVSDLPRGWLGDRAHPFMSYSVDMVSAYDRPLTAAGMSMVVRGSDFAIWRGEGGVTVRLIDNSADPATRAESTTVNNAGEFGPPVALTLLPCDTTALAAQLGQALGVTWRDPQSYTLPWTLPDGSTHLLTSTSTMSQQHSPFLVVENPHGLPGEDRCSSDYTPSYLIYATPDVSAAGERFASARMQLIGAVPSLIGAYHGGGISVEAVSPAFIPAQ
ncbi:hypothetical protein AB0B10_25370 [Micromonospora arborensis]|uniref:hypothetical protein n=1 Tax=Micromonospora arborensis TaxID=2116518 RepID=UPI0033D572DD